MSYHTQTLTAERLREMLNYDAETGVFTRRKSPHPRFPVGSVSGTTQQNGYRYIKIDGVLHRSCRLAFLYMTGRHPEHQIDHINGARDDDRWENLREATNAQNQWNTVAYCNNQLGLKNVHFDKKMQKFVACIRVSGKTKHLGCFDTLAEAKAARNTAAMLIHGGYAKLV